MLALKRVLVLFCALSLLACSSDDDDSGSGNSTFTLSGSFGQTTVLDKGDSDLHASVQALLEVRPFARTQCSDGFFYSVYCLSLSASPVAAEGDVDCANGGSFSVAGLPTGTAIGCFVRRYTSASATSDSAVTVGAVTVPASNLNGSTSSIVAGDDVSLNISLTGDGVQTTIVAGNVNENVTQEGASNFTAANINGVWEMSCNSNSGGDVLAAGLCKCFLGEAEFSGAGYSGQSDCLTDPQGPGAAITNDVNLGIGIYVYSATTQAPLPIDEEIIIPSGSNIHGISIWGASGSSGSYVSLKTGGEGVTDLGGALVWDTIPSDPTANIAWSTSVDLDDGGPMSSFTIPAVPSATATHAAWVTWIQTLASNALGASWTCNDQANPNNPDQFIWCLNELMSELGDANVVVPRVYMFPFCDMDGCRVSSDTTEFPSSTDGGDANAFKMARLEVEGVYYDYDGQGPWTTSSDYDALTPESDSIGIEPESRFVFEPLEFYPDGAGFRQSDEDQRHYKCGETQFEVQNAACTDSGNHFELVCYTNDELAIRFFETSNSSVYDVLFDQVENVAFAQLIEHTMNGPEPRNPTGTTAVEMCVNASGGGGGIFFATATKQ